MTATASRRRVVVGVDDSDGARTALAWALEEGARRAADVEVVAVLPLSYYWTDVYVLQPDRVEAARAQLEARTSALVDEVRTALAVTGAPGRSVDVVAVAGSPAALLVQRSVDADLLVVGSRGRRAVSSVVLGSVTLHCVAQARCPVVVVHPLTEAADVPARVVAGLDDSDHARAALVIAVAQAAELGARVDAVLAYEAPNRWGDLAPVMGHPPGENRAEACARGEAIVADVLGLGPIERGTVRVVAVEGHPRVVLLQEAVGALMLVVGSRSRNELTGVALGSVALHCATSAPCPVLVVHRHPADDDRAATSAGAAAVGA